jgi:hypothetical protein
MLIESGLQRSSKVSSVTIKARLRVLDSDLKDLKDVITRERFFSTQTTYLLKKMKLT